MLPGSLCWCVNLGATCRSNCWHLRVVYSTSIQQAPFLVVLWHCVLGCLAPGASLPGSSSSVQWGQWGSRAFGAEFVLLTGSCCALMIYVSAGSLLFMITRCADRIYFVQEFAFRNGLGSLGQAHGGVEGTNFQTSDVEFHAGAQGVCPRVCFETSSSRVSATCSAALVLSTLRSGGPVQLPARVRGAQALLPDPFPLRCRSRFSPSPGLELWRLHPSACARTGNGHSSELGFCTVYE